ncbi:MAG: SUMF1/EgtB/PvdO family nonheme iron enzyme [Myxococcales bacterium]|nr:SUMF1/EgtB/PvdO family nonheme iron enzyme [Myxococcales bacterium]
MDLKGKTAWLATELGLTEDGQRAVEDLLLALTEDRPTVAPGRWEDDEETTLPRSELDPIELSMPAETAPAVDTLELPEMAPLDRYEDLGLIGIGGMGEVRRMRDRRLGRVVAMKFLRPDLAANRAVVARFLGEAQIAAQLQHPGMVPVHDVGRDPRGRVWFAMKAIAGRGLGEVVREVHDASVDRWQAGRSGWTLHRLVEAFATVCEATGYAHSRGVVHRDLKPENIMVGAYGEILVLDWGIAKVLGEPEEETGEEAVWTTRTSTDSFRTRMGSVAGTAMYMAPEQVRGEIDRLDPRTDVWALGALLYEILTGSPPWEGRRHVAVLTQILAGPPEAPAARLARLGRSLPLPEELVALVGRAMSARQDDRPANGAEVATEARRWLEGAAREGRALELVREAVAARPEVARLRERASRLRDEASSWLERVPTWAEAAQKASGWELQDEADRLDREAELVGVRVELTLGAALTYAPDLPAIHEQLVGLHREEHTSAERSGDRQRAARAEARLREHADALPAGHPERERTAAYVRGLGALTLHTDPPGAEVRLYRCALRGRRLVPELERVLGETPLDELPLPMGRWVCELRAPGRVTVRYPVQIGRGEHWDGVPPEGGEPVPIVLPPAVDVTEADCVVPAGWFIAGGDPAATGSLPRKRLWLDGFVIRRQPVRFDELLVFLHDLVAQGREAEALALMPRRRGSAEVPGEPLLGYADGRFTLPEVWSMDLPALMVPWRTAVAYAGWESARTGQTWRLPAELEWEKAARGVDGRLFPWGDHFDASWACLEDSHQGRACVQPVQSFPGDESPYGVRGLAGNVRDWCLDAWIPDGPPTPGCRVPDPDPVGPDAWRVRRGGSWGDMPGRARLADRDWYDSDYRYDYLGFRLLRRL